MTKIDKNSMLYWFPKVKGLGIPMPKTFFVDVREDLTKCIYNPKTFPKNILETLQAVAKTVSFNYKNPLFIRTDMLSGKHVFMTVKWLPFVEKEEEILGTVIGLIEESAMAGILGQPINAFAIREYVELEAKFTAFCGMPVACERRYFVKNGIILCHHPYWIERAIKFWQKDYEPPENWKELLKELNTETEEEIQILSKYAFKVAYIFRGDKNSFWSIDFAKSKHNGWYLIDMALGEESWHPSDCPNCPNPEEMRKYEGNE